MPYTCQPLASAQRVTARMAAFIPGASPPEVSTAMLFTGSILTNSGDRGVVRHGAVAAGLFRCVHGRVGRSQEVRWVTRIGLEASGAQAGGDRQGSGRRGEGRGG